jgi:uncharacterized protein
MRVAGDPFPWKTGRKNDMVVSGNGLTMNREDRPMGRVLFHLAFPVSDLCEARKFYVEGLGCQLGRRSRFAMTLGLGGHQIIAHMSPDIASPQKGIYPRHFGLIFTSQEEWEDMADRANRNNLRFRQKPRRRFIGTRLEHGTFFLEDPFHNVLEFKCYLHESAIFGEEDIPHVGDMEDEF